jgi:hypothetical protein
MKKCTNIFTIYEEVVSHTVQYMILHLDPSEFPNICGKLYFLFYISVANIRATRYILSLKWIYVGRN